ncbi:glycosyltransferase family 2 protein [Acinetobacter junii]|uniref:glycosyltransferase family 2 protein n=1 Tax=Acinetobacter junii TaxID=40215 RepID=UPI001F1D4925|nr:glycosyltransferase family 2 protein [Acinetobacter junii]
MSNNMISVCLATYNGEKYIFEQLNSILKQLSFDDEIIVSDDHSTDKTLNIIRSINDRRIKIFMNTLGQGYTRNFENAIQHCKGNYIFLSDQDDVWMNNKVALMIEALQNSDLVISDALICDSFLEPTLGSHFQIHGTKRGFLNNWLKTRYIGACMAFRRQMLSKLLPFPKNSKLCAHDYWIANVGELFYRVTLIETPLIYYRRHGSNASNGGQKSNNPLSHKMKVRIYTLYHLMLRV